MNFITTNTKLQEQTYIQEDHNLDLYKFCTSQISARLVRVLARYQGQKQISTKART